jgi:uncharacterized phiE125 gp8 family phage protein
MIRILATTGTEPVTLAETKEYLRVDHADEDALITSFIMAARMKVERFTGLSLVAQTLQYQVDTPSSDMTYSPWARRSITRITLPIGPAVTITGYADATGAALDSSLFTWNAAACPTVISTTSTSVQAVTVTYTTGASMLTGDIKAGLLMFVHMLYTERGGMKDDGPSQMIEEVFLRNHRVLQGFA